MSPKRTFRHLCVIAVVAILSWTGFQAAAASTLSVAVAGRPPGLGNPYASMATGGVHPWGYMFDALTVLGDDGSVLPGLATKWEVVSPTVWRFHLRQGVEFANGSPFSAESVKFVIQSLQAPESATLFSANEARTISDVKIVDQDTVEIVTRVPDAILDRRLSHIYMVPEAYWSKTGAEGFALAPVGTGPYQLVDWGLKSGRFDLKRNPRSWRKSGTVDTMRFQVLPDATTREQALTSGQVNIAYNPGLDNLKLMEELGFVVVVRERGPVEGFALPNRDPQSPLADIRVRRAMNYAVNRDAMAKTLMQGTTRYNVQGALPDMFGYTSDISPYEYDPKRASQLLTEAGFPKGFDLSLTVRLEGKGPEWAGIYQSVVQDLNAVGIRVTLRSVPPQEWLRMWNSGDWNGADMMPFSWTSTYHDVGRAIETVSCAKPGAFFCVPEMMGRINATAQEFNSEKRKLDLQSLLRELRDLAPSINLFPQVESVAYERKLGKIEFQSGYYRLESLILDKSSNPPKR